MKKVVTFGEIMLRLSPPSYLRIIQTRSFDAIYGGGEANVAIALANFGIPVDFVTRLPLNEVGNACLNYIRQFGVCTDNIIRGGHRIGIYFLEMGATQRGSNVIYDRSDSAFATIESEVIDWERIFSDACWFHITGITPAISQGAAEVCLEAVKKARKMELTVSCDLNYRSKLWNWGKSPKEVMSELVKHADIALGNEEDADKVFGIKAPEGDVTSGKIQAENYRSVAERLMEMFPNLQKVAITLRGSIDASYNTWSGILYDGTTLYTAPVYDIRPIVDRVGTGDSFAAGLIYGFLSYGNELQRVLDFAVAASCLKHSIFGDSNVCTVKEVKKIADGVISGRVSR